MISESKIILYAYYDESEQKVTDFEYKPLDKNDHIVDYIVTGSGDTIVRDCHEVGCDAPLESLTLGIPAHTTYGDGKDPAAVVTDPGNIRGSARLVYQRQTRVPGSEGPVWADCPGPEAPVDAGTYRAMITLGDATAVVNYTIQKAAVTVKAQDREFTYNGTAQSWPEYTVEGLVGEDSISAEISGSITFPDEGRVANVVKSWTFTKGNKDNYTVTAADGGLTMRNAAAKITITAGTR